MKLESALQKEHKEKLKALGYFVYKHPPHPTGIPDLHAFKDGKHFWFEEKRSKEDYEKTFKNKAIQALRRREMRDAGDTACVVWKWKHIKQALKGKIPKSRM